MRRALLPIAAFMLALSVLSTANAETRWLVLAPVPVTTDEDAPRPERMLSMLAERVKTLKADGKEDEAKAAVRKAHQRVRESEEQLDSQKKKLHDIVEKLGKGKEVDMSSIDLPGMQKELKGLQKATKKLIKDDKPEEAAKLADGMHKKVREGLTSQRKRFAKMHKEIEKLAAKNLVGETKADRKQGAAEGNAKHDGDHHEHGHDGDHHEHGHDGDHEGHHDDDDDDDDHAGLHHGDHDHGDHDHSEEFEELQEDLEDIRGELKELRDLVREIRKMVK